MWFSIQDTICGMQGEAERALRCREIPERPLARACGHLILVGREGGQNLILLTLWDFDDYGAEG